MIYFLASIPRSGSTLLASLLGQREDTYVSPTSNLGELMGSVVHSWESSPSTKAGECGKEELYRTLKGLMDAKYSDRNEHVIFDKGRQWPTPQIMETMEKITGDPIKIVATVRPIAECIASFYEVDKSDLPVAEWIKHSQLFEHLMVSYRNLREGYEKYPDSFCIVEYDDLVLNTQFQLDKVARFLDIKSVTLQPQIEQVAENDNAWGVKDLHKLAPTIEPNKDNAREILGEELYEQYQGGEFWNDKPEPVREPKPIDLALEAAIHGKQEKSYEILSKEYREQPDNNRVAFNMGWHEMRRGNLHKGHRLMDRGRTENVFGTPNISFDKPLWTGQRNVKVLLEMEGGFGDQFHALRFMKNLVNDYGCEVVVGGCMPLAPIMRQVEGVTAIVRHEGSPHVDFDYWLPSMSAIVPLGLEYSDLSGEPYIPRLCEAENKIGVKWSGNPIFEHEQHRLFPSELMFNAVKDEDCICLQKEYGETQGLVPVPKWMERPSLETWKHTQMAISRCNLVITSCTGIAHLAGAMGVETWVVVPILPYFLWALPGNKTPYYDSVTLYRQEKYGDWEVPFKKIRQDLTARRIAKWSKLPLGKTTQQFIEA